MFVALCAAVKASAAHSTRIKTHFESLVTPGKMYTGKRTKKDHQDLKHQVVRGADSAFLHPPSLVTSATLAFVLQGPKAILSLFCPQVKASFVSLKLCLRSFTSQFMLEVIACSFQNACYLFHGPLRSLL